MREKNTTKLNLISTSISPTPLSLEACNTFLQDDHCGGLAFFVGNVRDHNQGNEIELLEFTSYVPMAEQEMEKLAKEIIIETGAKKLYCAHRIGVLKVGEAAVIIGVAAAHRDAAFTACRLMIDRLKKTVPIWKKEVATDGSYWINAHP